VAAEPGGIPFEEETEEEPEQREEEERKGEGLPGPEEPRSLKDLFGEEGE